MALNKRRLTMRSSSKQSHPGVRGEAQRFLRSRTTMSIRLIS
jgi:hypothetical protein